MSSSRLPISRNTPVRIRIPRSACRRCLSRHLPFRIRGSASFFLHLSAGPWSSPQHVLQHPKSFFFVICHFPPFPDKTCVSICILYYIIYFLSRFRHGSAAARGCERRHISVSIRFFHQCFFRRRYIPSGICMDTGSPYSSVPSRRKAH